VPPTATVLADEYAREALHVASLARQYPWEQVVTIPAGGDFYANMLYGPEQGPAVAAVEALDAEIAAEQAFDAEQHKYPQEPGVRDDNGNLVDGQDDDEDSNPTGEACGARARLTGSCDRGSGHPGNHRDDAGREWPNGGES
jgi:hypothetical protein